MTTCTAPVEGHKRGGSCPVCDGAKGGARGKSVYVPSLPPSRGGQAFEPAAAGEPVINGLVAREHQATGRFTLAHADSGEAIFHAAQMRGGKRSVGLYDSPEDALQWAENVYPAVASAASHRRPAEARLRHFCPQCQRPMIPEGEFYVCRWCPDSVVDFS